MIVGFGTEFFGTAIYVPSENTNIFDAATVAEAIIFAADSNMNVTASFQSTLTQFELVVNVVGKGSVTQNPKPVIATYDTAAVVGLTATPVLGWDFLSWSLSWMGCNAT